MRRSLLLLSFVLLGLIGCSAEHMSANNVASKQKVVLLTLPGDSTTAVQLRYLSMASNEKR